MKSNALVTVITLNFNQHEYSVNCIKSILNSDYENFNILVIDNGSTVEGYQQLIKLLPTDKRLKLIRLDLNIGYVGGINYALNQLSTSESEYVLIMNNDTIISSEAITNLIDVCEKYKRKAIVSGKIYDLEKKNVLQYIGQYKDKRGGIRHRPVIKNGGEIDIGQYNNEMEMGMLDDIFWLIPMALYKKIGGYSEYFYLYAEQNDFALRAIKENYKLIYTPNASLWHKGGVTTCDSKKDSPRIMYWMIQGSLKLAYLHLPIQKLNKYITQFLFRQYIRTIFFVLFGQLSAINIYAIWLAHSHYRHWRVIKYKDNGYNPFTK